MKTKIVFIFCCLLFASFFHAFSQSRNSAPEPDEEFNLFLFILLIVFICGMIGAAIIGALAAMLILFILFALISIGVLSSSVALGLYTRSYSVGFKSFLIMLFGLDRLHWRHRTFPGQYVPSFTSFRLNCGSDWFDKWNYWRNTDGFSQHLRYCKL